MLLPPVINLINKGYIMFRLWIVLGLLISSLLGTTNKYDQELTKLTPSQIEVLKNSLKWGKPDELHWILAGIAYKESNFGKYKVNHQDGTHGSYGAFQIQLSTAAGIMGFSLDHKNYKSRLRDRLIEDDLLSAIIAKEILLFWKRVYKGKLDHMLASYNGGGKGPTMKQAQRYAQDVRARIQAIKRYVRANNIEF